MNLPEYRAELRSAYGQFHTAVLEAEKRLEEKIAALDSMFFEEQVQTREDREAPRDVCWIDGAVERHAHGIGEPCVKTENPVAATLRRLHEERL